MPGVDYEGSGTARRYARGRRLPEQVLRNWRNAVTPYLPDGRSVVVLDLGAGTGIFARAWPEWIPCEVLAVEPAAAMRAQLVADGVPEGVLVLGAAAEHLPLAPASVDVAWLSAVVHHLDLDRAAAELARLLIDDGVVLVRGLFADLGSTPGLDLLPGAERAAAAFPAVADVATAFGRHGLEVVATGTVEDAGPVTVRQAAQRVRDLRDTDTLLRQFSDDEVSAGLAAMDASDPDQPLPPSQLGLVVLRRVRARSGPPAGQPAPTNRLYRVTVSKPMRR